MKRKLFVFILSIMMIFSYNVTGYAANFSSYVENNEKVQLVEKADALGLNVEKLENVEVNIQKGFEKLKYNEPKVIPYSSSLSNSGTERIQEVKISDNLLLGVKTKTEVVGDSRSAIPMNNMLSNRGSTYKVTSTSYIKHITKLYNLVTCNAVGRFNSDGTALYGSPTYSSMVWQVDTTSSVSDPYVICNFDCRLFIGIDPVGMEIQSKSKSCSLWFSSTNKQGYASWD